MELKKLYRAAPAREPAPRMVRVSALFSFFAYSRRMIRATIMLKKGMEVYVITTDKKNLCLSPTMYEPELLQTVEDIVKKEIVKYLEVTI